MERKLFWLASSLNSEKKGSLLYEYPIDGKIVVEHDEVRRKRMEELLIRREKRIAERGGGKPLTASSLSSDKSKRKAAFEETKKPKPILRSSAIDRLAAAKTSPSSPATQPRREALR